MGVINSVPFPARGPIMDDNSTRDDSGHEDRIPKTRGLWFPVCLFGAAVGALFGSFAYPVGTAFGALGGVLAGILWTRVMVRRARAGCGRRRLISAGTKWGIVVGLIATAVLHGGLIVYWLGRLGTPAGHFESGLDIYPFALVIGVICAVPAGAITGAICGAFVPEGPQAANKAKDPPPPSVFAGQ
jgi:hypothetical protein